jgi:hypothetical protein
MARDSLAIAFVRPSRLARRLDLYQPVTMGSALAVALGAAIVIGLIVVMMFLFARVEWFGPLVAGLAVLGLAIIAWRGARNQMRTISVLRTSRIGFMRVACRTPGRATDVVLGKRREYWRGEAQRRRACLSWAAVPLGFWTGILVAWAMVVGVLFSQRLSDSGFSLLLMVLCYGVLLGVPIHWGRHRRQLAEAAIEDGRCANCGYALGDIPPGLATAPVAGPAICPECATEWPLVPPATPAELRERLERRHRSHEELQATAR